MVVMLNYFFNISFHLKLQSNLKFAVHLCKRKVRNLNYVVKIGHDMKITKIICNESETPLNKNKKKMYLLNFLLPKAGVTEV